MKNLKVLASVTTALAITTSCSLFHEQEKQKPRIVYTNLPQQEVSLDPQDAVTKREQITVPSVSTAVDSNVTVKRIMVEDVQSKTVENIVVPTATIPTQTVTTQTSNYGGDSQPSSDAQVGQCYGKVRVAGTFKDVMEKVVVEPERVRKKTIPAKYQYADQEVVVREETTKFIEIPATYKTVTERVTVEPEKKSITTIPARYKTVTERVMVKPATKVWKKGRGLIEKTGGDGEIMCLVEEPAKYETVSKKVLVEAERQDVRIIPAVSKIITKEVINQPARVEQRIVPAIKKRISKKVLAEPERTVDINIPAVYKTVKKKVPLTESKVTWRPVLCDYNITPSVIMKLQEALTLRGYDTGGVDGVFGSRTSTAVNVFQKSLGLQSSGITIETLRALGVSY